MHSTLIEIGKQLLAQQSDLEEIMAIPKVSLQNKKGEHINNYCLNIIFDLDEQDIIISKKNRIGYKEKTSYEDLYNVDSELWGRRGNPVAVCVELKKIGILARSLSGEFAKAVERDLPQFMDKPFFQVLKDCAELKDIKKKLDKKHIGEQLKLGRLEKLILVYVTVKSSEYSLNEPTHFKDIEGYKAYIRERFLPKPKKSPPKLCYATGLTSETVEDAEFRGRFQLNKIFQSTTLNYATHFDKKTIHKNFQLDLSALKALDKSADYINKKLDIKIAGLPHHIIPQVLSNKSLKLERLRNRITTYKQLLFNLEAIEVLSEGINDQTKDSIFWLNFIAYETDGNSYKIVNQIKDVCNIHIDNLIEVFGEVSENFEKLIYSENTKNKYAFNLPTIYYIIPARKDEKEKKNLALLLFNQILEKRQIDANILFGYFKQLILCHWYKRYDAYSNMKYRPDDFYFGVKDAVFKYLALFKALHQLSLLKNYPFMETTENINDDLPLEKSGKIITDFLSEMNYTDAQKAMFYLGRVLSSIARAQVEKKHDSRPVLRKINYNGMDKKAIVRFRLDLDEKVQQYDIHKYTFGAFDAFTKHFNFENWTMHPEQAVFFILSGYAFNPKY